MGMRYESNSRDPAPNPEYERGVADVRRKELARIGYEIPANASAAYIEGVYGVAVKKGQLRSDAAPRFLDPMDLIYAGGAESRADAMLTESGVQTNTSTQEETLSSADEQRAAGFAALQAKFERGLELAQYGYRPARGHDGSFPGGSRGKNESTPPNDGPYGESARQNAPRVQRAQTEHGRSAFGGGNQGEASGSFGGGMSTPDTFGEGDSATTDARDAMIARAKDAWRTPVGKPKVRAMGRTRGE